MLGLADETIQKIKVRKEIIRNLKEEIELKEKQILVSKHHIGVIESEIKEFEQMLTALTKQ